MFPALAFAFYLIVLAIGAVLLLREGSADHKLLAVAAVIPFNFLIVLIYFLIGNERGRGVAGGGAPGRIGPILHYYLELIFRVVNDDMGMEAVYVAAHVLAGTGNMVVAWRISNC